MLSSGLPPRYLKEGVASTPWLRRGSYSIHILAAASTRVDDCTAKYATTHSVGNVAVGFAVG